MRSTFNVTSTIYIILRSTGRNQPVQPHWPFCFSNFRVLKPRKPAWILVAAAWTACCLFRTRKPRIPAWILVADFSSSASRVFCLLKRCSFDFGCSCCRCRFCCWCCGSWWCCGWLWRRRWVDSFSCLRTRYPRKLAWILVAAVLAFISSVSSLGVCDMNAVFKTITRKSSVSIDR